MKRHIASRSPFWLALFVLPLGCANPESLDDAEDPIEEAKQAVAGVELLDQQQTTATGPTQQATLTGPVAQTVTSGLTGVLNRVSVKAAPCPASVEAAGRSCYFNLRVKTVNAGGNPDAVIAQQRVRAPLSATAPDTTAWVDVTFATPATVQKGVPYALEVVPEWTTQLALGSGYAGGEAMKWRGDFNQWERLATGTDLAFRTWVTVTPILGNAICGDRIQLRSWKGDYLHRPDSPQGVTTWAFGEWTPENLANGNVQLRSWKGDCLHRPDSPQGVTTWAFGEWAVEVVP